MSSDDLFVIVPVYNEERTILSLLERMVTQSDRRFSLVLVDNASSDSTVALVETFRVHHPGLALYLVHELEKGTGAAADTGCRFAIERGARYLARTDADCLPDRRWVAVIRDAFERQHLEFVIGRIAIRCDDTRVTVLDRLLLPRLWSLGEIAGRMINRGEGFRYRFVAVAGNNMAFTASLYRAAGGFPRSRIEDVHEDLILSERFRRLTSRAAKRNDALVYNSIRRVKRYGYWRTLLWYWDHRYRPQDVDIR